MADFYRCTLFFESRKSGWTETYWNLNPSLTQVQSHLAALAPLRAALLIPPAYLVATRTSFSDPTKDSDLYFYPGTGLTGVNGSAEGSDTPSTCLTVGCTSVNNRKRKISLRGIPDYVTAFGGQYQAPPAFSAACSTFRLMLENATRQWAIRFLTNYASRIAVKTMQNGLPGEVILGFGTNPGFAVNDPITIYGSSKAQGLAGTHRVTRVEPGGAGPPPVDWSVYVRSVYNVAGYSTGAFAVKPIWDLSQIKYATVDRISHRNAGRAFFLSRGRRSPVKQT